MILPRGADEALRGDKIGWWEGTAGRRQHRVVSFEGIGQNQLDARGEKGEG